jgi:bifunctional non-homologous end joining protein LigD
MQGSGSLAEYRERRNFDVTPEPSPSAPTRAPKASPGAQRFVIQKHAARHLHYDLRLEMDGVLKSWALTRGPSLQPGDKRLAVRTEDHPLAYADFEGTIPPGEYGGGTVMLWDEGDYIPHTDDPARALQEGKLHITLRGRRLQGEWVLIRLKPHRPHARENWLFNRIADESHVPAHAPEDAFITSIRSGRSMRDIATGELPRAALRPPDKRRDLPGFVRFQLCQPALVPPDGADWIYEIKHDGYRAQLAVSDGVAAIRLRSGADWTARFPRLAAAGLELGARRLLLDGEIVVVDDQGRSRFGLLQSSLAEGNDANILFMAFDVLVHEDDDVSERPLADRKVLLEAIVGERGPPILRPDHWDGEGQALFDEACLMGLEGIISKRADAPYRRRRTDEWQKIKCWSRDAFRIIGWLPSAARPGFRSLLLGRQQGDRLDYAGKVGTGFSDREIRALTEQLEALEVEAPPTPVPPQAARGARWVQPVLQGDVAFAEVTGEGVLRHSRWLGLKNKEGSPGSTTQKRTGRERKAAGPGKGTNRMQAPQPMQEAGPGASALPKISNRSRVIFPDAGLTKGDLADYYAAMAPHILRHAGHRPLSLVRCPQGIGGKCFFQKHAGDGFASVRQTRTDSKGDRWLYVDDAAGLMRCVQMGTIEFHGWGSRVGSLDRPDRLVFDLDPDEGLPFRQTVDAAVSIRDTLADMGLRSWAMLSGGKGVHVIVPLDAASRWPRVKDFARRFSLALAASRPDLYVARAAKAERRGKIFIDWLRNDRGATSVMPWSARARPVASIAAPVEWQELETAGSAADFGLRDVASTVERAQRIADWAVASQTLPEL